MPRPCSVCAHKDLAAIDAELRSGTPFRKIAERFEVGKTSLVRHKSEHLSKVEEVEAPLPVVPSRSRARDQKESKRTKTSVAMVVSEPVPEQREEPRVTVEAVPDEDEFAEIAWAGNPHLDRETRVRIVMGLMASNRWERGVTGPKLAAVWEVALVTMEKIAAEASRRVRAVGDPEYVRTRLAVALDEGISMARGDDLKSLAPLAKAYAELADIMGPKRHEISGPGGAPLGAPAALSRLYQRVADGDPEAEKLLELFVEEGARAFVPKAATPDPGPAPAAAAASPAKPEETGGAPPAAAVPA